MKRIILGLVVALATLIPVTAVEVAEAPSASAIAGPVNCHYVLKCIYLTRSEQVYAAVGDIGALTALICRLGPVACVPASALAAAASRFVSRRGSICGLRNPAMEIAWIVGTTQINVACIDPPAWLGGGSGGGSWRH